MMDLISGTSASRLRQTTPTDPGTRWVKDAKPAIDAPPDPANLPDPAALWPEGATRTGIAGVVTPRAVALPGGGYRMYYTQILPRAGFPAGANDYDNSTTRILSAYSADGRTWIPEAGVRLSPQQGGAGEFRVVSPDVAPAADGSGRLRMYFECCPSAGTEPSVLRSAVSTDGGLVWSVEPGVRFGAPGRSFMSARIVLLEDGRCRLYSGERGRGIVSALSTDGGLTFAEEGGLRIGENESGGDAVVFAPEIIRLPAGGYRMYYAAYSAANRAAILTALSSDGLAWRKDPVPVIQPDGNRWDAVKCSEMGVICLPAPAGGAPRYRIFYEACDGTARNQRGVWRIAGAETAPGS